MHEDKTRETVGCYRVLTMRLAMRAAVAAKDLPRAHACAQSSSKWGLFDSFEIDLAYSSARAGIFDNFGYYTSRPDLLSCAVGGSIEGGHEQLAKCLSSQCILPWHPTVEISWLAARRGLSLDETGIDPLILHAAKGDVRFMRNVSRDTLWLIRTFAAQHGPYRVLWCAFRKRKDAPYDAYAALCDALRSGCRSLAPFRGHVRLGDIAARHLAFCASHSGQPRTAAALLRFQPELNGMLLAELMINACQFPSLRMFAFAARRLSHTTRAEILRNCRVGRAGFILQALTHMPDTRLSDALACLEFLLLLRCRPQFARGRLLAFQSPRKSLSVRAATCLECHVRSRLAFK